ncbi:TPA: hypothetical protein ACKRO0_005494 [Pseudomonas aeruginosa]
MTYVRDAIPWDKRGALFNAARNADESEFAALQHGKAPIESGISDEVVADFHHADEPDRELHWRYEEAALDDLSGPLIEEIDRRAALLGDAYPFIREGNALRFREASTAAYEFLLITSLHKQLSRKPWNRLPIIFEQICATTVQLYLGEGAVSYRTGWPPHDAAQRPRRLRDLMKKINELTEGEFVWAPRPPYGVDGNPANPKDEGLDFIAWKPFSDKRLGQMFLLGQCACGDDWEGKVNDLDINKLNRWLNPVSYADIVRVFAVPHHIPGHYVFGDVCVRAGLVFDRTRISIISNRNSAQFNALHGDNIKQMIELKINN